MFFCFQRLRKHQRSLARKDGNSRDREVFIDQRISNLILLMVKRFSFSEVQRLFSEIEPLYGLLHGYVRHGLYAFHGPSHVNPSGHIPVHLLGRISVTRPEWLKRKDLILVLFFVLI